MPDPTRKPTKNPRPSRVRCTCGHRRIKHHQSGLIRTCLVKRCGCIGFARAEASSDA